MISVRIMSVCLRDLVGMDESHPAGSKALTLTNRSVLCLGSFRPQSPVSSQPRPIWGERSVPGQTAGLMGVRDNTCLLEAPTAAAGGHQACPPLSRGKRGSWTQTGRSSEPSASHQCASAGGSTKAGLSSAPLAISVLRVTPCLYEKGIYFLFHLG